MSDDFLIRKGAYWYRPNAQGYTANVNEAGLFTREEALLYTYPNGPNGSRDGLEFFYKFDVKEFPKEKTLTEKLFGGITKKQWAGIGMISVLPLTLVVDLVLTFGLVGILYFLIPVVVIAYLFIATGLMVGGL